MCAEELFYLVFQCAIIKWLIAFKFAVSAICIYVLYFQELSADPTATLTAAEERKEKIPSPHLSHLVILTSGNTLYGLAERVVATESL